jgi:hypothetical protein
MIKILYRFSKKYCFDRMIKDGNITKNNKCGGMCGGDKHTNHLSYSCVDCKYLDDNLLK